MQLIVIAIFLFSVTVCNSQQGYYWRDYKRIVPSDAILAGKDKEGNDVYVGQAYVKSAGLLVGKITSGEKYVFVPYGGQAIVGKFVKILCGSPDDFYWMKVNATHFHTMVSQLHPVVGGHEDVSNEDLFVGRATVKDDLKIGKVGVATGGDNYHMYYDSEGAEKKLPNFELLMYKNGTAGK